MSNQKGVVSPVLTLILLVILIVVVAIASFYLYFKKDSSTTIIKPKDQKTIKSSIPKNNVDFDKNGLPIKPKSN